MIKSFADRRTQELYATGKAKKFLSDVAKRADRIANLSTWNLATKLDDLKVPPGNRLRNLHEIAEKILAVHPDPVPHFRLLRNVFRLEPNDPSYRAAKEGLQESKWVTLREQSQFADGTWAGDGFTPGIVTSSSRSQPSKWQSQPR